MEDSYNNKKEILIFDPLKKLQNIGYKLSDFQEIESQKSFTLLAKGSFGYIEKMKSKKNSCCYAIKKIFINNISPHYFLRETEIMINLDHDNIVKFYGYFKDKERIDKLKEIYQDKQNEKDGTEILCLVLEYVQNGTLEDFYKNHMKINSNNSHFVPIEQNFIIKICKQLLNALVYLSSKSIIHRDLKPDNILLDENYNVKISDFNLSALLPDQNPQNMGKNQVLFTTFSRVGRIDFVSPEVESRGVYDFKVDIFSLGLTMLCLMSYEYPIKLHRDKKPYRDIDFYKIHNKYNIYLKQLVLRMTNENQHLRPYPKEALEDLEYIDQFIRLSR